MYTKENGFVNVFDDEPISLHSEAELKKQSELDKLLDEIELDIETDCFDDAIELLDKIEADIPRELWVFSPRFHMNRLMADLECCDGAALAAKYDEVVKNSSYKKAKNLAAKQNNTKVLAHFEKIEAKAAEMKEKEAQRLAEEAKRAEERKRREEERRLAEEAKRKEIEKNFEISDGVLIKYRGSATAVVIPDCVTSIGEGAFHKCEAIISIAIPNSVTSIGMSAFCCCTSLRSITIPNSVTSIGECAFPDCKSLTSITIPDSVTSIGDGAFSNCKSLTSITVDKNNEYYKSIDGNLYSKNGQKFVKYAMGKNNTSFSIPNSVTSIDYGAFNGCKSLTSITIPDSVTSIGIGPFYNCESLTSITVDENNEYYKSIDGNLYLKNGQTLVAYAIGKNNTSFSIPNSVTNIDNYAFFKCKSLTSITIPNSVTSIGFGAFEYCESLTSITIPDSVTSIGNWAFNHCKSLTSITIPDSVRSIGHYVFSNCTSLTSITIPDRLVCYNLGIPSGCKIIRT